VIAVVGGVVVTVSMFAAVPASGAFGARDRAPDARAALPASYFGMSVSANFTQLPSSTLRQSLNLMKGIGVHWLRVTVPWGRVDHVREYPDKWKLIDRAMSAAATRGMVVDAIIDNPPDWAAENIPHIACKVQPPFDLTAYAKFAAAVAKRYPSSVLGAIELENSPNLPGIWRKPDACAYATLVKTAYPRIKAVAPDVLVLNGGIGGTTTGDGSISAVDFLAGLYRNGVKGDFDALSFHPYSYPCIPAQPCSKDRTWNHLPDVRALMVQHGDGGKQIWATEFGAPTNGVAGDGHVDEQLQSDILRAGLTEFHQFPWAGPFFAFTFRDYGTNPRRKADWFGLVSHDLRHHKIAFDTYRELATGRGQAFDASGVMPARMASRPARN